MRAIERSESSATTATMCEVDAIDGPVFDGDLTEVEDDGGAAGDRDAAGVPPGGESAGESTTNGDEPGNPRRRHRRRTVALQILLAGLCAVVALAALAAGLWFRVHQTGELADRRAQFVQVASQGALNLTTIDWEHAEADVTRILDSASGSFYDDFAQRSQPFLEVVKQTKSKSVGSVTEAGLESASGNEAQVLVAINVTTTVAGTPEPVPRSWRMRVSVQQQGDQMKISNVEFVP